MFVLSMVMLCTYTYSRRYVRLLSSAVIISITKGNYRGKDLIQCTVVVPHEVSQGNNSRKKVEAEIEQKPGDNSLLILLYLYNPRVLNPSILT